MPAPVTFSIALAEFPASFDLTPQEFAQAIADRLTVSADEPWSSFANGGTEPVSDVGPWLAGGTQWKVWSSGAGAYVPHTQHGSGLVDATVTLAKLAPSAAAGSLLYYNNLLRPAELTIAGGTSGQFLKNNGVSPVWADAPTPPSKTRFEVARTVSDQSIDTSAGPVTVLFDTVRNKSTDVTFDSVAATIAVNSGEVWFFYASIQIEDTAAASTGVQVQLLIKGAASAAVGAIFNAPSINSRFGCGVSGVLAFTANDLVKVTIEATETTPVSGGLEVAANDSNTRFGGFRLA